MVGVHRDGPYAINAFLRADDRPFAVFADVEASVASAYDLRQRREGMAGVTTARRAIFVLDPDRRVRYRWLADDWISPAPRRAAESAVDALPAPK